MTSETAAAAPAEPPNLGMSASIDAIAPAMARAQGAMFSPRKDRAVEVRLKDNKGSYKFRYTTLGEIHEMIREPLATNELFVVHQVRPGRPSMLCTRIVHSSGQWMESTLALTPAEQTPQALGSAITYAKRYNVSSLLSIASDDDDDGAAASGHRSRPIDPADVPTKPAPPRRTEARAADAASPGPVKARFQRMILAARAAVTPANVLDVLRMWQADMEDFMAIRHDPERAQAWATLLSDMPAAIARAHGPTVAGCWRRALEATDMPAIGLVHEDWTHNSRAEVEAVRRIHPVACGMIAEHLRAQYERVQALEESQDNGGDAGAASGDGDGDSLGQDDGFAAGRALAASCERGFLLRDDTGTALDEVIFAPAAFVSAYARLHERAGTEGRDNLEAHNSEALLWAQRDPAAAAALAALRMDAPAWIEQVVTPMVKGKPDFPAFGRAAEAAIATLDADRFDAWLEAHAAALAACPASIRLGLLKTAAERRVALGKPPNRGGAAAPEGRAA